MFFAIDSQASIHQRIQWKSFSTCIKSPLKCFIPAHIKGSYGILSTIFRSLDGMPVIAGLRANICHRAASVGKGSPLSRATCFTQHPLSPMTSPTSRGLSPASSLTYWRLNWQQSWCKAERDRKECRQVTSSNCTVTTFSQTDLREIVLPKHHRRHLMPPLRMSWYVHFWIPCKCFSAGACKQKPIFFFFRHTWDENT